MINHFKLLGLLLMVSFFSFGQRPTIVGHWQLLPLQPKVKTDTANRYRDLILTQDSTYTIVGDDTPKQYISGWHTGGSLHGKWEQKGKLLFFYLKDIHFLPVTFRIRRLTKSELWLQVTMGKSPISKFKRYE